MSCNYICSAVIRVEMFQKLVYSIINHVLIHSVHMASEFIINTMVHNVKMWFPCGLQKLN